MPDNFISYEQLLGLNKAELDRMEREAEERWQSANAADEAAQRSLTTAGNEMSDIAARSGYQNDLGFSGSYRDYVKMRDSASAQWKAYRTAQQASQNAARGAFESAATKGKSWRAAGDDENWGALEASQRGRVTAAAGTYRPPQQTGAYQPQAGWNNQEYNRDVSAAQQEVARLENDIRNLSPGPARDAAMRALPAARKRLEDLQRQGDDYLKAQRNGTASQAVHHGYANQQPQGVQAMGSWMPPPQQTPPREDDDPST